MSTLRNYVRLIGHLGIDPEMKNFESGKKRVQFRLATQENYQVNGEWKSETQWHTVVAWNRTADRILQYLSKGSYVLLEGKLTHRVWEDTTGQRRYFTEIQASNFVMLDKKSADKQSEDIPDSVKENLVEEDDLPF